MTLFTDSNTSIPHRASDGAASGEHTLQFIIFTAISVVPCRIALYTCNGMYAGRWQV